jgi:thiamine kinase-like enzyme
VDEWKIDSYRYFNKVKALIPSRYIDSIDSFFRKPFNCKIENFNLCHNDLGIEHILVNDKEVTGIIDWGGVAIADVANDFARIYLDLGDKALDSLLASYTQNLSERNAIKERAMFYGRSLIFEEIYFARSNSRYSKKSFDVLSWMFG